MDDLPIKQPKKLKLYKALKIAYIRDNPKRQAKMLKKFGYILDNELSNPRETMVAYNPFNKKVIFVANGTDVNSEKDLITDLGLAVGGIKQSARYDDTKQTLTKAHDKYKDAKFVLAGTSLGGALVNYASTARDKVITYNPAFTPGAKARENVQNYRTSGDIISTFAPKENTTILKARKIPESEPKPPSEGMIMNAFKQSALVGTREILTPFIGSIPATAGSFAIVNAGQKLIQQSGDLLKPHKLANIQSAPIFL